LFESGLAGFMDLLDDVFISRLSCSSLNLENHDSDNGLFADKFRPSRFLKPGRST
jgi:hypothetical protein